MSLVSRVGLAAAVAGTALALTGCGSSGGTLLSSDTASALSSDLTQASEALAKGNCVSAQSALSTFHSNVGQLTGVNSTLVQMLSQGASTITNLAQSTCSTGASTTTSTRTSTVATTTTTQTQTTTTSPETTGTQATSPATTSTVPTTPGVTTSTTPSTPSGPAGTISTPSTPTSPSSGGAGLSVGPGQ